jgi:hypothetical protein
VSGSQSTALLKILVPAERCPSRSTAARTVQDFCAHAGELLQVLDRAAQEIVRRLASDEIFFHRQVVLMGVEPLSLAWVLGQRAEDRSGQTWAAALAPFRQVEFALGDQGQGLQKGLRLTAAARAEDPDAVPLEIGLEVFHPEHAARRVLRFAWRKVEGLWAAAEAADREVEKAQRVPASTQRPLGLWKQAQAQAAAQQAARQGGSAPPPPPSPPTSKRVRRRAQAAARAAWSKAFAAFEDYERCEAAWARARQALQLFQGDGRLTDAAWAAAELAAAAAELSGPRWGKVRRMLLDERLLTFLRRCARLLAEAVPPEDLRTELVRLFWLRRQQRSAPDEAVAARYEQQHVAGLAVCRALSPTWRASSQAVGKILRETVRASSLVEGLNSVIRMHQARHRSLTQDLLDLKRLFWNLRVFREGKRKDTCPYALLGLELPTWDAWELLTQWTPAALAAHLGVPWEGASSNASPAATPAVA